MRVVLDYDGLLNDLPQVLLGWINDHYGREFDLKDVPDYTYLSTQVGQSVARFWKTPGYYGSVRPLPGAREFVESLKSLVGEENISVCTSTPAVIKPEKDAHITEHFGIPKSRIVHETVKHPCTRGAILVDDYRFHALDHVRNNDTPAILFDNGGMYGWSKVFRYEMRSLPEDKRPNLLFASSYEEILQAVTGMLAGYK